MLAPNMGKQLMVAPNVGQAACCFFSTSRIASSEVALHQTRELDSLQQAAVTALQDADVEKARIEAIKAAHFQTHFKWKKDNKAAIAAIKKMKQEDIYKLRMQAWDNLVFLRPLEDEQQKLIIKGMLNWIQMYAKLHTRPAIVAKHQWMEARGKYALGETDIVEVAKVTKDTTMAFIADPKIAKMAKEQGAVVPTFDEQKGALEKATTPEEVLSICDEIHDGMEKFLLRFRANSGYSSDDVESLKALNGAAYMVSHPRTRNPIKRWQLNKRNEAAHQEWAKRNAIRWGYAWTGFGDGGRADWIRFYLVFGLVGMCLMKIAMLFYWNMMKGRGKDKWI